MPVRTKKHHTDEVMFYVSCPSCSEKEAKEYLHRMGCRVSDDVDAKDVFPDRSPGTLLAGARYREDLTQQQLSEKAGIPRRHISEMENNKRPIGKGNAKKLAEVLGVDYRLFL